MRFRLLSFIFLSVLIVFIHSCQSDPDNTNINKESSEAKSNNLSATLKQFSLVSDSHSNVDFTNTIKQDAKRNTLYYTYLFNGGGVATGDINNDGLLDIYFCGNQQENKLYLNKGDLVFEDITQKANVIGSLPGEGHNWSSGVSMVDINNDGYLDIYVCRGGPSDPKERMNLLYINNGDLSFTESAQKYGINDPAFSTHAVFFDYDNDNDLDLYVLNHPVFFSQFSRVQVQQLIKNKKILRQASGKFFERVGPETFVEKTEEVGLMQLGYGLGVNASDINNDGWVDLYIANDFSTPDFLMINQGNKTFKDQINQSTKHISFYGMGCDVADINNDGHLDIFVADMTAEDHVKSKTLMPSMRPGEFYGLHNDLGYQYQYMFNTLQLNNGNNSFSEIAQFAGLHKTDWSWSPQFADFDNDGDKDLFVTNGWMQDTKNNDFLKRYSARKRALGVKKIPPTEIMDWVNQIPSHKSVNYIFSNENNLTFEKRMKKWGIDQASFSNGSSIADLDLDGDLDIVVNNINEKAFIYKNNSTEIDKNNYLRIKLKGDQQDKLSLNAKVKIYTKVGIQYQDYTLSRGYASSCEPYLHFGLKDLQSIERLEITWLDGTTHVVENVKANQALTIEKSNANGKNPKPSKKPSKQLVNKKQNTNGLDFQHKEFVFDEFKDEILLPHNQSSNGPFMAIGDVNKDGNDDIFIGGAHRQSGALYIQKANGSFSKSNIELFKKDANYEDMEALFFDVENDGDLDLYVVSGGGAEINNVSQNLLQDRLYINNGKGNFTKATKQLPTIKSSGQVVRASDIDMDGDLDLFVGGRLVPGKYPTKPRSYILENQNGVFTDATEKIAPDLANIGMINDAIWADIDNDKKDDLIVLGEWMPISIFKNGGTQLNHLKDIPKSVGWWQSIQKSDLDNDGDLDFVVGNIGLNNKFINRAGKKTLQLFTNDFDGNGSLDIVLANDYNGKLVPVRGKECSTEQMPFIKDKFQTYDEFANSELSDILGTDKLEKALHFEAEEFRSCILLNTNDGFKLKPLPNKTQLAPVKGIEITDINNDGNQDLILVGNMYGTEVETVRYDAGVGTVLLSDGQLNFKSMSPDESGFFSAKDSRDIKIMNSSNKKLIIVSNNNDGLDLYNLNR